MCVLGCWWGRVTTQSIYFPGFGKGRNPHVPASPPTPTTIHIPRGVYSKTQLSQNCVIKCQLPASPTTLPQSCLHPSPIWLNSNLHPLPMTVQSWFLHTVSDPQGLGLFCSRTPPSLGSNPAPPAAYDLLVNLLVPQLPCLEMGTQTAQLTRLLQILNELCM